MKLVAPAALVVAAPTLLRQGLLALLREQWPALSVTLTADIAQLADLLAQRAFALLLPDAPVVPGALLPGLLQQVRARQPGLPTLLLAARRTPVLPLTLRNTSPLRLLSRYATPAAVATAVSQLLEAAAPAGGLPPVPRASQPSLGTSISPRELEVLALLVADVPSEDIAERLCLSVRTVDCHRRTLLLKAGARSPVGLVVRALREGWITTT